MSATMPPPGVTHPQNGHQTYDAWRDNTRVFLQPIAAPSILGLFGFAGATFIVASNLAGWYGTRASPDFLFPFAALFGGLAQFSAGMWAYRARDGLATAMHGMWGSFWIAYGVLFLLAAARVLTLPTGSFPELGFWFIALAVITFSGMVAALAENLSLTAVLATLFVGAGFLAMANITGTHWWEQAGGYILVGSAFLAWYTASAMMIESTYGRVILPLFPTRSRARVSAAALPDPRISPHQPIEFEWGEPGVRHGQ